MKRKTFLCIIFILATIGLTYEEGSTEEMYLLNRQDILRIALENNKKLISLKKELIPAETEVKKAYSELYPHLSIKEDSSYTKWLKRKKYEAEFKAGDEILKQTLEEPAYPPYSKNVSISLSQQIFSGGKLLNRIELAREYFEKSVIEYELNQQKLLEEVLESYYTLRKLMETKKVYQQDILKAEFLVNIMEAKLKEGLIPEVDLQRAKLNLRESQVNMRKIKNKIEIALNNLKRLLGLSILSQIKLKEEELIFSPLKINTDESIQNALINRLEVQQSIIDLNSAEHSLKIAKSERYPQISLQGNYIWQSNEKTIRKSIDKLKEYQWLVSLNIELPLFDGGYIKSQIKSAQAGLDKAKINYEIVRESIIFEVQEALTNLKEIEEIVRLTLENRELAEQNLKIIEIKYNEGKIALSELFNAQEALTKTSLNYIESICDYELAKLKFYKTIGNIYAPLGHKEE